MATVLLAILVVTAVFVGLTGGLMLAEKWLVNYGDCTITVNNGEKEIVETGGCSLLTALQNNQIHIPSACGGKGTCGYCKVVIDRGGGPVLPTETPYLSRVELRNNIRLACQVKVKSDMDIHVPDFLEVLRNIIDNKTYDPNRKWRFIVE